MIRLEDISIRAGIFKLEGISLHITAGQYGILMGPTGCGKTTLLEIICGLRRPDSGCVLINGNDVTRAKPAERGIGYIPQDGALFTHMTVRDQLGFALRVRGWSRDDEQARVAELAEQLGIAHLLDRKPVGLSGGEIQRVAMGRALAFRPNILCLDEPLSALDHETRLSMCDLLQDIRKQTGVSCVHVTHDLNEAARLADAVFRLEGGVIKQQPLNT